MTGLPTHSPSLSLFPSPSPSFSPSLPLSLIPFFHSATSRCSPLLPFTDPVSVGMTEWERQREREEFSRTARIYQPLSVSLSSRFTRAEEAEKSKKSEVHVVKVHNIICCLASFPFLQSPEPDSVQAARANLFGVLTREVVEWHPHRVLCKRFNVPDPYPK